MRPSLRGVTVPCGFALHDPALPATAFTNVFAATLNPLPCRRWQAAVTEKLSLPELQAASLSKLAAIGEVAHEPPQSHPQVGGPLLPRTLRTSRRLSKPDGH